MGLRNNEDEARGLWVKKKDERDCGLPCGLAWQMAAQQGVQPVYFEQPLKVDQRSATRV